MSPRPQSPLTLEFVLLGLLDQQSMHGYELHKALSRLEGVGLVWRIKQSQLYALLERLEVEGLLGGRMVPGENRPARCEYSLTSEGRTRFETWRSSPVEHQRDVRQEFLARLYFARLAGGTALNDLLRAQTEKCRDWLADLQSRIDDLTDEQQYEKMVYRYRIIQTEAVLNWLMECERVM